MKEGKTKQLLKCALCAQLLNPEEVVIVKGLDGAICADCIEGASEMIDMYTEDDMLSEEYDKDINTSKKPSQIHKHLDDYVIGQDYAKQVLSVATYNHYKSLYYKTMKLQPVEIEKSNVILVGPTGSGKTHLIQTLSRALDVPYAIADACTLTEAGYVGTDVEDVLKQLLDNAEGEVSVAEKGIIYIDEIDKLMRNGQNPSTTKDVGGEGVQQALLKMIEGSEVKVPTEDGRRNPRGSTITIDTSNILFIFGGSFQGIEDIIKDRVDGKSSIGFGSKIESPKDFKYNDYILDVSSDDLREFGLIPELVGRIPIICPLTELTEEELMDILTEPKNALTKQYIQLLDLDGVELHFDEEAIAAVADKAILEETGARGLRSIIERTLLPHMYNLPDREDITSVTITKGCIEGKGEPIFEYINPDDSQLPGTV